MDSPFSLPDPAGLDLLLQYLKELCQIMGAGPYNNQPDGPTPTGGALDRFLEDHAAPDALAMVFSLVEGLFESERERWDDFFARMESYISECFSKSIVQ